MPNPTQSKLDQLAALRKELSSVPENLRNIYTNGQSAEKLLEDAQIRISARFEMDATSGHPEQPHNAGSRVMSEIRGTFGTDLAALAATLDALEISPVYAEAKKIIAPLVDNIRKLEAEITAEAREVAKERQAKEDAKAAAKAKALAAVEAKFATA